MQRTVSLKHSKFFLRHNLKCLIETFHYQSVHNHGKPQCVNLRSVKKYKLGSPSYPVSTEKRKYFPVGTPVFTLPLLHFRLNRFQI